MEIKNYTWRIDAINKQLTVLLSGQFGEHANVLPFIDTYFYSEEVDDKGKPFIDYTLTTTYHSEINTRRYIDENAQDGKAMAVHWAYCDVISQLAKELKTIAKFIVEYRGLI